MSLGALPLGVLPLGGLDQSGIVGTERLYLAGRDFTTLAGETPANRYYRGAAIRPLRLNRSVIGAGTPVETIGVATGEIEVANGDGYYDGVLTTGSIVGREVIVQAVERSPAGVVPAFQSSFASARILLKGAMSGITYDLDRVAIGVRSKDQALSADLQSARYAGTGGAEGGDDLKDKPKPIALGQSFGVAPVYLGVIGGKHSFQVSGGIALPIGDVPQFFDRGLGLTKVAGTPAAGEYAVDTASGIVTIGGAAPGFPTCNVDGYAPGGTLLSRTGDLILAVLETFALVPNVDIDVAALSALAAEQPAPVGLWIGTEVATAAEVVAALLRGITAYGGFDRLGRFTAGRLTEPGGVIRARFDGSNIFAFQQSQAPRVMDPPAWRHEVAWQPSQTVSTDLDINASAAQRAFMAERVRLAVDADVKILEKHLTSRPWRTPGLFAAQSDAAAEAARLVALYRDRRLFRVRTFNIAPELDIGATVEIDLPRFGLNARAAVILGLSVDAASRTADVDVFL